MITRIALCRLFINLRAAPDTQPVLSSPGPVSKRNSVKKPAQLAQDPVKVIISPQHPPTVLSGRLQGVYTPVSTWMIQTADKPSIASELSVTPPNLSACILPQLCRPATAADGVYQANGHCQEAQPRQPGLQHGQEVRVCLAHSEALSSSEKRLQQHQ